jgi:DNA repair protein SbcC/Rad50
MKIQKLIIQNFRIFHGTFEFNFEGKELVILVGPNGHGKSSIFDAIQWCFTGEIQRYKGTNEYQEFNYLINDLSFRQLPVTTKVEIWLKNNNEVLKVARSIRRTRGTTNVKVYVNGKEYGVREGAEKIRELLVRVNNDSLVVQDKEQNMDFARFFSTSQLLSQDQLRAFVQNTHPKERFRLLENLLGLKKYGVQFRQYLNEANEVISKKYQSIKEELDKEKRQQIEISTKLQSKREIMEEIGEISESELIKEINKIVQNIAKEIPSVSKFEVVNESCKDELVKIRNNINRLKESYGDNLNLLQESAHLFSLSLLDYESEKEKLNKNLNKLNSKVKSRLNSIDKANNKIVILESFKKARNEYKSLLEKINSLREKKEELRSEEIKILNHQAIKMIEEKFLDFNEFQNKYESFEHNMKMLIQVEEIKECEERIKNINKYKEKLIIDINNLVKQESLLKTKLRDLNEKLLKIEQIREKKHNEQINLIIDEIQRYLLSDNSNKHCRVCGTDFGSFEKLQEKIRIQMKKEEKQRSEIEQVYVEQVSKIKMAEKELDTIMNKLQSLRGELEETNKKLSEAFLQVENLKIKIDGDWISKLDYEEVKRKKVEHEDFINRFKLSYSLIKNLEQNKKNQNDIEEEIRSITQTINELKENWRSLNKYFDDNFEKINSKIKCINNYISRAENNVQLIEQQKKQLQKKIDDLEDLWKKRKMKEEEISLFIPSFTGEIKQVESAIDYYKEQIDKLQRWDYGLHKILLKINSFLSKGELSKLSHENKNIEENIRILEEEVNKYEVILQNIEELKNKHSDIQSNLMSKYLTRYSKLIDQLFMQISPHAFYRHVHLVPRNGNLYIVIDDKSPEQEDLSQLSDEELEAKFNASLMFSSGQASVLAVCIFLALNKGQNWTNLNFLGIDDPFQNMDDVNIFSFIDVLSQIGIHKQILISTHSKDFANLLISKMDLPSEKIGYIYFKSYSSEKLILESNCLSN